MAVVSNGFTQQADVGALTNNTGVAPDTTIADVPATTAAGVGALTIGTTAVATTASVDAALAVVEADISDLANQVNAIRTVLRNLGLMA